MIVWQMEGIFDPLWVTATRLYIQLLKFPSFLSPTLKCVAGAYVTARDWLMSTFKLSEDEAISALTVACDFQVTQVRSCKAEEDEERGLHIKVPPTLGALLNANVTV